MRVNGAGDPDCIYNTLEPTEDVYQHPRGVLHGRKMRVPRKSDLNGNRPTTQPQSTPRRAAMPVTDSGHLYLRKSRHPGTMRIARSISAALKYRHPCDSRTCMPQCIKSGRCRPCSGKTMETEPSDWE